MKRVAVIGGGISGLAAAFRLEKQRSAGAPLEYVIFESGNRFGGVIHTEHVDDCVLEAGPDSFLSEKPWAADLCRELGLEDQLIGSNDAERVTCMLVKGRLVPIPDGLMFMVPTKLAPSFFSPLFSWHTKLRILGEWFYQPAPELADTTVAAFVERHYGREMVERVADPLLAGVYGGSADELSVRSVLPRFLDMEAKHGSLGRAMVAARKRNSSNRQPKPLFTSLKNGMQQLVDGLLARIPRQAQRLNTAVEGVKPESGKWLLFSEGRTQEFDGVIVATPAYIASHLVAAIPAAAEELKAIPYSSSVTAVFVFDDIVRKSLPPGFGFLVPRGEGRRILAATFVHNKFPHRAPRDRAVIRCFLGGSRDEPILRSSDSDIQNLVLSELRTITGISAQPLFAQVQRWNKAMAQYTPGHSERMLRIQKTLGELRGLALAGNAYGGIGVPDCVRSGTEAAQKMVAELAS
ncbi:MAG TPA: protoporphyrinogen oxidase [Terriglobales bacterium]